MADIPLRLRELLADDELATALLALVSDGTPAGETRKYTLALLAEALHAVNALEVVWESTTLFEDYVNEASDADFSETYNLDFKSGNSGPRRSFADGYTFFTVYVNDNTPSAEDNVAVNVFAKQLLDANATEPLGINRSFYIDGNRRAQSTASFMYPNSNNTSFRVQLHSAGSVAKIEGWKQIIRPSSL